MDMTPIPNAQAQLMPNPDSSFCQSGKPFGKLSFLKDIQIGSFYNGKYLTTAALYDFCLWKSFDSKCTYLKCHF